MIIDFLTAESESANAIKSIITTFELISKKVVKKIITDNGGEFVNANLKNWLLNRGVIHELTVAYSPQQTVAPKERIGQL